MIFSKNCYLIQVEQIKHENVSKKINIPTARSLASILIVHHLRDIPLKAS